MIIRDIQDAIAEVLGKTVEDLPAGATKEDLRNAVEKALKEHPDLGQFATIEDDDSEAGFQIKVSVHLGKDPSRDHNVN